MNAGERIESKKKSTEVHSIPTSRKTFMAEKEPAAKYTSAPPQSSSMRGEGLGEEKIGVKKKDSEKAPAPPEEC